jgi:hypothetical protein
MEREMKLGEGGLSLKKHLVLQPPLYLFSFPSITCCFCPKMNVHESDAKKNPCVAAKSSPSLHKQMSVDDCTAGECWEAVLARSMSERPDDVFDMFERYRDEFSSFALRSTSVEEREDIGESFEDRDERETRDETDDGNIIDLIQKLKLSELIERIQLYPHAAAPARRSREPNASNELRKRLDDEIIKSRDLARRLDELENHRQQDLIDERAKVAALEAKMEEHQRASNTALELEQHKSTHLGQKLRVIEESHSIRNKELEAEAITNMELHQKLKELEMRYQEELSEYISELNVQETTYGEHLDGAQKRMEFLQRKLAESEKILLSEQERVQTLERSNDSSQALLESERKKVKHLKLADIRNQCLLQTEQNKVKVLEQSISDLKSSIEKLSKKAMILDGAQDQIVCLTQELERRDSLFACIRQIVNADADSKPKRETEKKDFLSYARQYNTLAEAGLVRVDPMQDTAICHPYSHVSRSPRVTSSCAEPTCETKKMYPAHIRDYKTIVDSGLVPVHPIQGTVTFQSVGYVHPSPSDSSSSAEPQSVVWDE